jgi:hypothetical protein
LDVDARAESPLLTSRVRVRLARGDEGRWRAGFDAVATLLAPPTSQASAQQPTASLPTQRAGVQRPWRMSVRADNDAFNFWRSITDRPDKEYTNGDQVVIEIAGAPWWGKRFAKRRSPCDGAETPDMRCLTTALSVGQDMYTPKPVTNRGRPRLAERTPVRRMVVRRRGGAHRVRAIAPHRRPGAWCSPGGRRSASSRSAPRTN